MTIYINSEIQNIPEEINNISQLLAYLKISPQGTGVALNNHLIPSRLWDITKLNNDDHIIIITATYGG